MKKILGSVGVLAVVGALVLGATGAFFSDTETSTGNTFTAGAIDLKVDSTQHYNNAVCDLELHTWQLSNGAQATTPQFPVIGSACGGTWTMKDLVLGTDKFFNFADIKPGDSGEDTISLHVLNNDAYVCATVSNLTNADNGTTGPEGKSPLNTEGGDLQKTMVWKVWKDDDAGDGVACDNIQQAGEPTLTEGHPSNGSLALYDSATNGGAVLAGGPNGGSTCLGVSWSLPASSGNETQTDSMTGDISFNVVQSRNNGSFVCGQEAGQELPGILSAQDFGVWKSGTVNGYSAGWALTQIDFTGAQSIVVKLYDAGNNLLQTDTATIPAEFPGLTQISSPFDVFGTFPYVTDGYWTNVRQTEYGQTVQAAKVVATVTLSNGKVVTATNTNLTGDSFLPGAISAQDFGVMNFSSVIGYSAGFSVDTTFTGAQSIVVKLYSGTTLLQTDTATALLKGTAGLTQISSPFDVKGTLNYLTDGYWTNVRGGEYGLTLVPTKVVATVTLANGKVVTVENTNLTGNTLLVTP